MPKVSKTSKLRRVARRVAATSSSLQVTATEELPSKAQQSSEDPTENPQQQTLSRGQRKRQAKRDQYLRREKLILSTLKLKAQEEQKKRIDGLDAIREALLNTTKEDTTKSATDNGNKRPGLLGKTSKSKKQLVNREVNHFNLVLQHPAYKSNPFGTMQEHLRNTLARQKEQQEADAEKRAENDDTNRQTQKNLKKERLQGVKSKSRKKFKATRSRS